MFGDAITFYGEIITCGHKDVLVPGVSLSCFVCAKWDVSSDKESWFQHPLLPLAEDFIQTRHGRLSSLLEVAFVLCVCWNAWLPSPRLREDGFPHSVQIKFIWVNVEFYPTLLMYESH